MTNDNRELTGTDRFQAAYAAARDLNPFKHGPHEQVDIFLRAAFPDRTGDEEAWDDASDAVYQALENARRPSSDPADLVRLALSVAAPHLGVSE